MELVSGNKYLSVVSAVRQRIVKGLYKPGHRLPTRLEMGKEFGVGAGTVQKALGELTRDGFVEAHAKAGTFVSDNPPNLCDYGVIIPASGEWSHFYTSLRAAMRTALEGTEIRLKEYITSEDARSTLDMDKLCDDIVNHRLAGLILSGPLEEVRGTAVLDYSEMPRVLLQPGPEFEIPSIGLNRDSFLDRAIEYLVGRGRTRIAHLCMDYPWHQSELFESDLRQRGLEVHPYWIQAIPVGQLYRAAKNVVNLLMQLEGEKRPNALIIHDDNIVEHGLAGLIASGVDVPGDIEIVAKCNYPSPVPIALPVKRLGLDCRKMLDVSFELLELQRKNCQLPQVTRLPAMFEDEISNGFT